MKLDRLKPWPAGEPPEPAFCGEEARTPVLISYGLDALEDDPELAEITRFAAALFQAPIALVSLVEEERQRFLVRAGLEERETPRPISFCAHAMLEPEPMVIPDARLDPRFDTNPLVTGHPYIRFYAGAPLISQEGAPLGSLCVIDTEPRPEGLTQIQRDGLQVLAASVMRRLRHRRESLRQRAEINQSAHHLQTLLDSLPNIAYSIRTDGSFEYVNARFGETTGVASPRTAEDWRPLVHPDDHEPLFTDWYTTFANGEPFEAQFRLKQRDGSWRWVLTRVLPVEETEDGPRWFGTITDIEDTIREAEARKLLANELSHRIKNLFAVIGGLVRLKSREYPEADAFTGDLSATLDILNRAHGYVTQENPGAEDTLHGLLQKLLAPYGDGTGKGFALSGADVPVRARSTTALALVFHELATNSAKYGAFSVAGGNVAVSVTVQGDLVSMRWEESGGPELDGDKGAGFGSRLVERTVNGQLRGELNRFFEKDGLIAVLTVPSDSL